MPWHRRLEAPLGGLPDLQPPTRELDLHGSAELLAHAPEGAASRAAPKLVGFQHEDVRLALFSQVVGQCPAGDAAADDRRPDTFRSAVNLTDDPGPSRSPYDLTRLAADRHPAWTRLAHRLQPARDPVRDSAFAAGDPLRARPQLRRDGLHHFTGSPDAGRRLDSRRPARHPVWRAAARFRLRSRPRRLHFLPHPSARLVLGLRGNRPAHAFDLPGAASPGGARPALVSKRDRACGQPLRQRPADGQRAWRVALAVPVRSDWVARHVSRLGGRRGQRRPAVDPFTAAPQIHLGAIARDPRAWQVAALFTFQNLVYYTVATWLPFVVKDRGPSYLATTLLFLNLFPILVLLALPLFRWQYALP